MKTFRILKSLFEARKIFNVFIFVIGTALIDQIINFFFIQKFMRQNSIYFTNICLLVEKFFEFYYCINLSINFPILPKFLTILIKFLTKIVYLIFIFFLKISDRPDKKLKRGKKILFYKKKI
jgi:hypothetical protein